MDRLVLILVVAAPFAIACLPKLPLASESRHLAFLDLHAPDGIRIAVNVSEISSIREPREGAFHERVRCTLVMTNKSYISVAEDCGAVRGMMTGGPCVRVCGAVREREQRDLR